jgi:hypothetical protein
MSNYFAALDDSDFVPVANSRKSKDNRKGKGNGKMSSQPQLVAPVVNPAIVADLTAFTRACESGALWGDLMFDISPTPSVVPDLLPGRWRRARDSLFPHLASSSVVAPLPSLPAPAKPSRWDVPPKASPAAIQQLASTFPKFPKYLEFVGLFVLDLLQPSYQAGSALPDYCAKLILDSILAAHLGRPVAHFFVSLFHAVAPRATCSPQVLRQVRLALQAGFNSP